MLYQWEQHMGLDDTSTSYILWAKALMFNDKINCDTFQSRWHNFPYPEKADNYSDSEYDTVTDMDTDTVSDES